MNIELTYNQKRELESQAKIMGVSLKEYVEFLLDEHTNQSYDRRRRLEIARIARVHYFK